MPMPSNYSTVNVWHLLYYTVYFIIIWLTVWKYNDGILSRSENWNHVFLHLLFYWLWICKDFTPEEWYGWTLGNVVVVLEIFRQVLLLILLSSGNVTGCQISLFLNYYLLFSLFFEISITNTCTQCTIRRLPVCQCWLDDFISILSVVKYWNLDFGKEKSELFVTSLGL